MADTTSVDETVSTETKQESKYSPDAQKAIDDLTKKLEKAESERKKANEQDAEKRLKLKEIEEKKLQDEGKLSELVELRTKEREELAQKVKDLENANQSATTKLQLIETVRRNELLAKLPQDKARNYEGFSLDVLETITKDFAVQPPPGNSQGSDRGAAANGQNGANKKELPLVPFAGSDAPSIKILADILNN